MQIQENISLKQKTTFKIGGQARYYVVVEKMTELKKALVFSNKNKPAHFILGGGSNLLVADQGFEGLVVKIRNQDFKITNQEVVVGAGCILEKCITETTKLGLAGLEMLTLIPGTVGGAIVGNAGSFGKSMSNFVVELEVYDVKNNKIEKFTNQDCQFSYRDSFFKNNSDYIIWSAKLKLEKDEPTAILNRKKQNILNKKNTLEWRPSAGCVFKNLIFESLDNETIKKLEEIGLDLEKAKEYNKVAVGQLIDFLGLKGFKIGGALISENHANFIVNTGKATASDVIMLESLIKQKIRDNFGIQLESEQVYLGF